MKIHKSILYCFIILFTALFSCKNQTILSEEEQQSWKYKTVRYWEKIPKKATEENKFNEEFDEYYIKKANTAHLSQFNYMKGDTIYLEIQKQAPSLHPKFVAIGIKLVEKNNELIYYEEGYRTWKMNPEILKEKADLIYKKWVNHKDLSPYYGINHAEEYIEFPSNLVQYDIKERKWSMK